jgi:hypothetical protein
VTAADRVPGSSPPSCFLFEEEDDETVSGLGSSGPDGWAATAGLRSVACCMVNNQPVGNPKRKV